MTESVSTAPCIEHLTAPPPGVNECFVHCRDGTRIAGKIWGKIDTSGLRLLACHGWLDNANSWDHLLPFLRKALPDLCVVAIDFSGHGKSTHRTQMAGLTTPQYLGEVDDCVIALQWDRFGLLAHSMGGVVATIYAAVRPERVICLVTVDSLGPISSPAAKAPDVLTRWLNSRARVITRRARVYPSREQLLTKYHEARPDLSHRSVELLLERGSVEAPGGFRFRHDALLTAPNAVNLTEDAVWASLRRVVCPTLAVMATQRSFSLGFDPDARFKQFPNLRVITLDATHHLHMEIPETVAKHVEEFLRGVNAAPKAAL